MKEPARRPDRRWGRMVGWDGYGSLLLTMLICAASWGLTWFASLAYLLRHALGTPTRARPADWIVVFGHALQRSQIDEVYAARLKRAAQLAASAPASRLLLLGGYTTEATRSEAAAGAEMLTSLGVAPGRIQLEEGSRHTLENLQNARAALAASSTSPVFLSSRYHLARIHVLAKGMGLAPHQLCAAEDRLPLAPRRVLRLLVEALYIHWYWVARAWAELTQSKRSLERLR